MGTLYVHAKNHRLLLSVGSVLLLLGLLVTLALLVGLSTRAADAACSGGSHRYQVIFGDTLGTIASREHTTWQQLASFNHLADANLLFPGQTLCIPGTQQNAQLGPGSSANLYAIGQCTWWADLRYHEFHGVFVPWTTNADAWQWTDRAHDFGWQVSGTAQVGDIIDLQPNVQLASALGHVGVVEQVLPNGHVLASNRNWGPHPEQVTTVEFVPGPGVTFLRHP